MSRRRLLPAPASLRRIQEQAMAEAEANVSPLIPWFLLTLSMILICCRGSLRAIKS